MCGIAGQARADASAVDGALVFRMCAAQEHRGPDSRGVHMEPGVALGIQRLRIIDLATGDQPILSEDGNVVVVLNGEIYNFRELRRELEVAGHVFRTQGDTETIVHLYERDGVDFVRHLHGMFAIAVWDRTRRQLVLARDRAGKKPLFYAQRKGVLSFASELPALLEDPEVDRELDFRALDAYLAYRYVPAPLCAFRAVRKLPPACTLVFRDGRSAISRYWSLDFGRKQRFAGHEEMLETLREQLRRAVRRRMISDVPIGAFLSGGIDSATVVALMAQASADPVKTFSIGFRTELDELPLARLVAERYGTDHHELVVEPKAIEIIPKIVEHHGEPFADPTSVPTFYLAALAREHVTVALNGDGGDELFAGYTRYVANLAAARLDALPPALRGAAARVALTLPSSGRINSTRSRIRRLGETLPLTQLDRYVRYMTDLLGFARERLYTDEFRSAVGRSIVPDVIGDIWRASAATNIVDHMLEADTANYLPDDLLAKVDIATMASSLEGRSPLLDHELMEFAASLPSDLKLRRSHKKVALREAMRGIVPDAVLDAPKRGFQPPLAVWLRGELRELTTDVLLDPVARGRGYFRAAEIERLVRDHVAGREDHSQGIWTLLMFEMWHRRFVDSGAPATGNTTPASAAQL
jgi:asparagine synthase (glutamine-hydrolysing)